MRAIQPTARPAAGFYRQAGVTLIELLVAVVVIAIMAAVAMPSFREMTERNRLTTAANEIVAALQTARIEAVRRNRGVQLCPSTDGDSCSGSDWSRLVLLANGEEDPIREVRLNGVTLTSSEQVADANGVGFGPDGFARVGAARSGVLSVCSTALQGDNAIDVIINVSRVGTDRRAAGASCSAPGDPDS